MSGTRGDGDARRRGASPALALLLLAACGSAAAPLAQASLSAGLRESRPEPRADECWAEDTLPAVIETVTDQVAEGAAPGAVQAYRTRTRQRIVEERRTVWIRTPCPWDLTPERIATLQRALKARGVYDGPVTARLDRATAQAVRRYQSGKGLESDVLSRAAAERLGVLPPAR